MGAPRARKDLVKSRRRAADDEGEEEGSVVAGIEDDSLSEASAVSDADDDADIEGSDGSDAGSPMTGNSDVAVVANGHRKEPRPASQRPTSDTSKAPVTTASNDTETMMNGLSIEGEGEGEGEAVAFDDLVGEPSTPSQPQDVSENQQPELPPAERSRREHEEYKKRRDADPAFVPNRGVFFMHDHRSSAPGQNGFRPFGRGRGRGRGNGVFPPSHMQLGPTDAPWSHDLHETVAKVEAPSEAKGQDPQRPPIAPAKNLPNRSFSGSRHIGNVQLRILLRGMSEPIDFAAVPVNQHTRLPHHRPPLRRDKPVRISLPEHPIRYIFPATERSFIFIPRALRPNQQGFGRARGRGSFAGSYSGFGPLSSRRTSAYAGSGYSPSVAMSRRSSLAREVMADGVSSPAAASFPRPPGVVMEAGKPVVRLPPAAERGQYAGAQQIPGVTVPPPTVNLPQPSSYPHPQKQTFQQFGAESVPIHHPRPERTLQVGDIDSPATLEFNPPQPQQQQPFHQQMPQLPSYQPDPSQLAHSRHPSHPSQVGTPLQHIPETAVHAQSFQPYPFAQQGYYPQPFVPPVFYYPPGPPSGAAPPFVPGQPYYYPMPVGPATQQPAPDQGGSGQTVAHESGGMVYYYNPADLAQNVDSNAQYQQNNFAGSPMDMGDMVSYYAPPAVYYPPQPPQQ